MWRRVGSLVLPLLCLGLSACGQDSVRLSLAAPISPINRDIAGDVAELVSRDSRFTIAVSDETYTDEGALDALLAGDVDLAMVSNNIPHRAGVGTVMPLFPTILHIGYQVGREAASARQLFEGAKVFAGIEGSASFEMFDRIGPRLTQGAGGITFTESFAESDVFVLFVPISPERLGQFRDMRLFSLGAPEDIGRGSIVDAITLMDPQIRPFVIPVSTYSEGTPQPVVTVAVDMLLVARTELDTPTAYDLILELLRLKPALASLRPGLFSELGDDIDVGRSSFVLHPALLAFLQRDVPTIFERYSGAAEVLVTVFIALASASFAGVRYLRHRKKNRIDRHYLDVMNIRDEALAAETAGQLEQAKSRIRDLQNRAFRLLVDEKLLADDSFRIFMSLSNDVLAEIGGLERGVDDPPSCDTGPEH